uniref:Neuroendocrine protein 7B2 n=1 Tax=Culicoides sonorensis TaxID=179676 RepID=A0A336M3R4_CULSO
MLNFSAASDYKQVLNRLKNDFDRKWAENKPSTSDRIKDYEDIRVLGSGAFGVVNQIKRQKMGSAKKLFIILTVSFVITSSSAYGYISAGMKDHFLSDMFFRDLVDRRGNDFADTADSYIDSLSPGASMDDQLALMARKDLEAEQLDYDSLLDNDNHSPSLRDQEYLQHSSLWGHQYVSGGAGEGPHRVKPQVKTDASLPAYCNPPNPCPVGYTEDMGCTLDFENTAAFSREYQASQECMCDSEHMFNCDSVDGQEGHDTEFKNYLARQFQQKPIEHKNLVAKKFFQKKSHIPNNKSLNPYLQGEKLPIAAKKGFNVN